MGGASVRHPSKWLAFDRLAELWAAETNLLSDEVLARLISAFWLGEFEDKEGKTSIHLRYPNDEQETIERRDALYIVAARHLPIVHLYGIPKTYLLSAGNKKALGWLEIKARVPWGKLSRLLVSDYPYDCLKFWRELYISRWQFRNWCRRQNFNLPDFWFSEADKSRSRKASPQRTQGRYSQSAAVNWYEARVKNWPAEDTPPNINADITAAKEQFRGGITIDAVRMLRRTYAPHEWKAPGRRKDKN